MIFLMETKLRQNKMELIRYKLGYSGLFVVDCIGRKGGDDFDVEIQNYSQHHINGIIQARPGSIPWKIMGFYGHLEVAHHKES